MAIIQSISSCLICLLVLGSQPNCDYPCVQNRVLDNYQDEPKQSLRDKVRQTFIDEIGVSEEGGDNKGDRIGDYLATTGLDEGYPWCAAFLSWGFTVNAVNNPQSAWSPDWFPDNKIIYRRGSNNHDYKDWEPTDVIGLWFQSKERIAHVGAIDTVIDNTVLSVEGNTNDYSEREGDRVMRKRRYKRQIHSVARYIPTSESSEHSNEAY